MAINKVIKINTGTATLPLNVASGSLIVVGIGAEAPVDALALTSPRWAGNMVCHDFTAAGANRSAIYGILTTSSGVCTITCGSGNLSFGCIWAIEIPGATNTPDDTDAIYTGVSPSSTNITTVGATRVICTVQRGYHSACVFTDGSSSQIFDQVNGQDAICMQILNAVAAGAFTPTISMTGADNNPMISVAFPGSAPTGDGNLITQLATEIAVAGEPQARITQMAVEVAIRAGEEPGEEPPAEEPPTEPLYSSCDDLTYEPWPT